MRARLMSAAVLCRCAALYRDMRGVSAVEFALILPLMITLYIGAVEFSHALTIDRRVTTLASSVADLVAQVDEVSDSDLDDIFKAAESIMKPYSLTPLKITVTSVRADAQNKTTVAWSKSNSGSGHANGSNFTLPAGLTQRYSSVIVAEVTYTYTPEVGQFLTGGITLSETFYLRPRRGEVNKV